MVTVLILVLTLAIIAVVIVFVVGASGIRCLSCILYRNTKDVDTPDTIETELFKAFVEKLNSKK